MKSIAIFSLGILIAAIAYVFIRMVEIKLEPATKTSALVSSQKTAEKETPREGPIRDPSPQKTETLPEKHSVPEARIRQDIVSLTAPFFAGLNVDPAEEDILYDLCIDLWQLKFAHLYDDEVNSSVSKGEQWDEERQVLHEMETRFGGFVRSGVETLFVNPRTTRALGLHLFRAENDALSEMSFPQRIVLLSTANVFYSPYSDNWLTTMTGIEQFDHDGLSEIDRRYIAAISKFYSDDTLVTIVERISSINRIGILPVSIGRLDGP